MDQDTLPGISPFLCDELTMPGKRHIRCHQCFDFVEHLSGNDFSLRGQSYALFVSEPKTLSIKLILGNTIFFDQIVDDCLLLAVEPAGQGDGQKLEIIYDVRHC